MSEIGAFAVMRRRRFLRWGLGAVGSLAGLGTGGYLALFGAPPRVAGLRVLTPREHRAIGSLVPTILGASREDLRASIAARFDAFLADEPADVVGDLRSALTWLELGPVLYEGRATIFAGLAQAEREAHFSGWMAADDPMRRVVATAFRKFVNLVAYDDPSLWEEIHYPGPAMGARGA